MSDKANRAANEALKRLLDADTVEKQAPLYKILYAYINRRPPLPRGKTLIDKHVVGFLRGENALQGVHFGERPPSARGAFWWREFLPSPKAGRK